jgi:hypothetical protein
VWVASVEFRPEHQPDSPDPNKLQYRAFVAPQRLLKTRHHISGADFLKTFKVESQPTDIANSSGPVLMFGSVEDYLGQPKSQTFDNRECSFTRVTPDRLAAIQRGIDEDYDPGGY